MTPLPDNSTLAPVVIKLSRAQVVACGRRMSRSRGFSYSSNIEGRLAIVYATDDDGCFYGAYRGLVERVSTKSRRYALKNATPMTEAELCQHRECMHILK
jgi:hypothetical protein